MIVLGIDPGLATMGYGVIEQQGMKMRLMDYGCVLTPAGMPFPQRLDEIRRGVCDLCERFRPDAAAFEELFFTNNVKTGIAVAQARGVALAEAYRHTEALYEYTPMQIKLAVTGHGRADKVQVQTMVKLLLNLKEVPKPDDAADAVAVAMCHAQSMSINGEFRIR